MSDARPDPPAKPRPPAANRSVPEPTTAEPPAGNRATVAGPGAAQPTMNAPPAGWSNGLPQQLPVTLGRYRLLRLLGQGGMAAVYLAHDTQLDRPVAFKIPSFAADSSAGVLERFLREARAAATLSHPNICPVYDVGQIEGVHYLTMAYIEGKPLQNYISPGRPAPPRAVVGIVRQLALAMQVAHEKGIVHRDLKPANVLIDARRQPIIMDFGLARRTFGRRGIRLTQEGALLGTPAYMPPEQVQGEVETIGPGCDIYSLGVILYEMLTGRLPFQGALGTLLAQIVIDPPPPPSRFRPDLDPTLEAICLKALAKKPEDRFHSMKEFAAALKEYLSGAIPPGPPSQAGSASAAAKPGGGDEEDAAAQLFALPTNLVTAPPPPKRERAGLGPGRMWWLAAAGLAGVVVVGALVLVLVLVLAGTRPEPREAVANPSPPRPADAPHSTSSEKAPGSNPATSVARSDTPTAPKKPNAQVADEEERRFEAPRQRVCQVAFAPDGRSAFSCGDDGFVHRWDLVSRRKLGQCGDGQTRLNGLACAPDGRQVLTAGADGSLRLWDVDQGKELFRLRGHTRAAVGIALSPGGRHAVSAGEDGAVYLWDLRERRALARFTGNEASQGVAGFSPDCRRIVAVGQDFAIRLWDVEKWQQVRRLEGHTGPVARVVFSPDGRYLLSGSADRTVRLWDVESGRQVRQFEGHTDAVHGVAFSPDGRRALSGSLDRKVRLWEVETGKQLKDFTGPAGVQTVAFSPDGAWALSGHVSGDVVCRRLPPAEASPPAPRTNSEPPLPGGEDEIVGRPAEKPSRLPVPGKNALAEVEKLIAQKYPASPMVKVRPTRLKVLLELRKDALDAKVDSTTRYALWMRCRDLAVREGDAHTAIVCLTDVAATYDADTFAQKQAALTTISQRLARPWSTAKGQPAEDWKDANRDCAEAALGLAEDAIGAEHFASAEALLKLAETAAARVINASQLARARAQSADLKALEKEYRDVQAARASLKADATAAQASLVIGKSLALTQGHWDEALPFLAAGGEERWKAAADADRARPADAAARRAVGDLWWKLGEGEQGKARARLYWRACVWYERALPGLEGPVRAQTEARIARVRRVPPQLQVVKPWQDFDLSNPGSGFRVGPFNNCETGYRNGRWFMRCERGWFHHILGGTRGRCPTSFACRVVGRVTGSPSWGWMLEFAEVVLRSGNETVYRRHGTDTGSRFVGVVLGIDSEGRLHRSHPGTSGEEIGHRAIRPHGEPNDLVVVVHGRHLEIYVNGLAVRDPLILDHDLVPADIAFRVWGRGASAEAEFERVTLWPGDDIPTLQSRAALVR